MNTKYFLHTLLILLHIESSLFASGQTFDTKALEQDTQEYINAMIVFDYEVISLPQNGSIDMLGMHYLQQLNKWLYVGIGVHAPLVQGDYGGFMAFDVTAHVQHKIYESVFVNAGVSLGGGGGGSSVAQSKELSGTGGFIKTYAGLGYEFDNNISVGVNYTNFKFIDSQIDSSQVNVFAQIPLSYSVNLYSNAGNKVSSLYDFSKSSEHILTLELNNLFQIEPTGTAKETINNLALQYSHFLDDNYYLFLEIEVGYKGLPLYNQFTHGIGYKTSVSNRVNLYGQLGIGSGGYAPETIDTGSGLLIYPKTSIEYLLSNDLGLSLSGGYLFAPTGTSKNYTAGAAINYHISNKKNNNFNSTDLSDIFYKGFRFNVFAQSEFAVTINDKEHNDINMLSLQVDNLINDNFYFATQISVAFNEFKGYPGYGEALFGLGVQNKYLKSTQFQNFFQVLLGTNVYGLIIKPSISTNYTLNDRYALYAQLGYTKSIDYGGLYREEEPMSAYSVGLGVTYRFSF